MVRTLRTLVTLIDFTKGKIKAFKVTKNSASYFLGDAKNDSLQRVYGIAFPEAKIMKEWERFVEEAERRDHRKIGQVRFSFNCEGARTIFTA
jgi:threonyl-tRNA synthetase